MKMLVADYSTVWPHAGDGTYGGEMAAQMKPFFD